MKRTLLIQTMFMASEAFSGGVFCDEGTMGLMRAGAQDMIHVAAS